MTVSKSIAEHKAKASDAGQLDRAVRREVDRLSKMVEHTQPRIRIEYNPDAKIVVVQMVDPNDPSKVLRSFPSDEFVKMMASMRNPSGLIVNGQG
ncbi:MAG: flagellar protein FlaG [Deltaproteobacteria bacterium]